MSSLSLEQTVQFAENAPPRSIYVLLLDASESMRGAPLEQLGQALEAFTSRLASHPREDGHQPDVAVITFGAEVEVVRDFVPADQLDVPRLSERDLAGGVGVAPSGAIRAAVEQVDARRIAYLRGGTCCLLPTVFMFTTGVFGDAPDEAIEREGATIRHELFARRVGLVVLAADGADVARVSHISRRAPVPLGGLNWGVLL
jgi:uncharacterized protein YegL